MSIFKRAAFILVTVLTSMLIIPLITVNMVASDAGMLVALLLLFVLNPIVSAFLGILAGGDFRHFWSTPIFVGILFWFFSSLTYKTAFPEVYSVIYFIICTASMIVTCIVSKILKK